MAVLALGVVGAGASYALGFGAAIGYGIGSAVGNYFFGPTAPDTEGPRLGDLAAPSAREGADIPLSWGSQRVAGTVIWADPDLTEIAHEQEVGGKGGSSPTHTTYSYQATFAVAFGRPRPTSAKLRRLWLNKELVYDARPNAVGANRDGVRFYWYDGAQTAADSIIESYVGTGNAPAYKGACYCVFQNLDLTERYGNRRPSVEAEIVTDGSDGVSRRTLFIKNTRVDASDTHMHARAPDGKTVVFCGDDGSYLLDVLNQSLRRLEIIGDAGADWSNEIDYGIGFTDAVGLPAWLVHKSGVGDAQWFDRYWNYLGLINGSGLNGLHYAESGSLLGMYNPTGAGPYTWGKDLLSLTAVQHSNPAWWGGSNRWIGDSNLIGLGDGSFILPADHSSSTHGIRLVKWTPTPLAPSDAAQWGSYAELSEASGLRGDPVFADGYVWYLLALSASPTYKLIRVNPTTMVATEIDIQALGGSVGFVNTLARQLLHYDEASNLLVWKGIYEGDAPSDVKQACTYDISTSTLQVFDDVDWGYGTNVGDESAVSIQYDSSTRTIAAGPIGDDDDHLVMHFHRIGLVDPNRVLTASVIDDLCSLAGVTAASVNTSGVSSDIQGFTHTRVLPARGSLEQLLQYKKAYGYQDGYSLVFDTKGGGSVATIDADLLGARGDGESAPPPLEDVVPGDTDIAARFALTYPSYTADYQPITQTARWFAGNDRRLLGASVTISMTDAEALDAAQFMLQTSYDPRTYKLSLPRSYSTLSPGDPITVPVAGANTRMRIARMDRGITGRMELECVRDEVADLTTSTISGISGWEVQYLLASTQPDLVLLDTTLIRDIDDDHPGPYVTAYTQEAGNPAIGLYQSPDDGTYSNFSAVATEPKTFLCATVPSDVDLDAWDTTNTLRVTTLTGSTLSSTTEAAVFAGANAVAWGAPGRWEIMQFRTATLVSTGVYDLTNLLRGRRGTEWAMDDHAADDLMLVLSESGVGRHVLTNADIDATWYYKAARNGTAVSDAETTSWTVGKNPLKPYAPVEVTATHEVDDDYKIDWTRRTRRGGSYGGANSLIDGVGGPISEDSEEYELEIYLNGSVTAIRTVTGLSSATYTYSKADQTSDGSDTADKSEVVIWQISAAVDRGFGTSRYVFDSDTIRYDEAVADMTSEIYYKFAEADGDTVCPDSSGNARDGTYGGGALTNAASPFTQSDSIRLSSTRWVSWTYGTLPSTLTFSAWVNTGNTDDDILVGMSGGLVIGWDSSGNFGVSVNGDFTDVYGCSNGNDVRDSTWHHVLITVTTGAANATIYFDNALQTSAQQVGSTGTISFVSSMALGRRPGSSTDSAYLLIDRFVCLDFNPTSGQRSDLSTVP